MFCILSIYIEKAVNTPYQWNTNAGPIGILFTQFSSVIHEKDNDRYKKYIQKVGNNQRINIVDTKYLW
jgi:hypothetical protein